MNNSTEWIIDGMIRASIGLSVSAILVLIIIQVIKLRSPRAEQIAWSLVLAQGLLWVPVTIPVSSHWLPSISITNENPSLSLNESLRNNNSTDSTTDMNLDQGSTPLAVNLVKNNLAKSASSPDQAVDQTKITSAISWNSFLFALWLTGIVFFMGIGWIRHRKFVNQLNQIRETPPEWNSEWQELLRENQVSASLPLIVTDNIGPALCRSLKGYQLVVPQKLWSELKQNQRLSILRHELAHYLNGDIGKTFIARSIAVLHWFNPLAWLAVFRLETQMEFACDRVAAGKNAEVFAETLIQLGTPTQKWQPAVAQSTGNNNLVTRVHRLLDDKPQSSRWKAIFSVTVAVIALFSMSIRFQALAIADESNPKPDKTNLEEKNEKNKANPAKPQPIAKEHSKEDKKKKLPDAITYTGQVVNFDTGKPIKGATIEVIHELSRDPKTNQWITLQTTHHKSDQNGKYSFTLPPEEVAESSLYIEIDAHHPEYQSKGRSGYGHSMILKNIKQGDPPFFTTIKLVSGKPVTGTVLNPDGTPASNVRILTYSKIQPKAQPKSQGLSYKGGAFQYSQTDEKGHFRIVIATPGDGVLWIFPKKYSQLAHRIGNKRGDIGPFQLQAGTSVTGQIVDEKGKPIPNVGVNLRKSNGWNGVDLDLKKRIIADPVEIYIETNGVSNGITTGAKTDKNGNFRLKPLPPGLYQAKVNYYASDPSKKYIRKKKLKMDHVFPPMNVIIKNDKTEKTIKLQAVPQIIVRGRFLNSQGKPVASHRQSLNGQVNDQWIFTRSTSPGKDGWFEFKVVKGLEKARLELITNEHSALRWRLKPGAPLKYGSKIELGTLNEGFSTLEIVRYKAPILLLKAVDEKGKLIRKFQFNGTYKTRPAFEKQFTYINGPKSDLSFEEQEDGRWRSSQLLPDEELSITIEKEGYTTDTKTVNLKEKEIRELVFVFKKSNTNKK